MPDRVFAHSHPRLVFCRRILWRHVLRIERATATRSRREYFEEIFAQTLAEQYEKEYIYAIIDIHEHAGYGELRLVVVRVLLAEVVEIQLK